MTHIGPPHDDATAIQAFNVRVYGLWVNSHNQLLVTRERHQEVFEIYKFPGGGLELGEGALEGLRREFYEETSLPVLRISHFYTTDFFQRSYFRPNQQIISLYYRVWCPEDQPIRKIDPTDDVLEFQWRDLATLQPTDLTFPIDQHVAQLLLAELKA